MTKAKTTPDTSKEAETATTETLVEKTPLGLSKEQMEKSNPEAVQKIKSEAAEQARAEAKAEYTKTQNEMKAAFPNNLDYAISAHAEGLSVEQAKVKHYDKVIEENQTLKEENATLKKDTENMEVSFAEGNDPSESAEESQNSEADIENTAASIWNKMPAADKAEFGNVKTAFFAYYKKFPEEFTEKK